ncbi:MAG: hypothetical protein WC804_21875 [Sphingomonas sp.]|jgi:hypothetical protein|uniref:hypothetical protein n=1 Tax=Sphingomonas sp. TaxID=28214 RepID=UPI003567CD5C
MASSQFREFVHKAEPLAGVLGLTHVTDCARLEGLVQSGRLEPRRCDVFGEDLIYLFYGKPAYRRGWQGDATSNLDYARICLILRDKVIDRAHRILPFDSGGFARYCGAFHDSVDLCDFEIEKGDHPLQVIGAFYDSLERYWTMNPAQPRAFPVTQNIVRSYYQLITGGLAEKFDDRCATIEVQLADPLQLQGEVLAMIGPNQIFDDPAVKSMVTAWGAEPRGYRLPHMFNPSEVAGRLFSEVERFLEERGWL